jgi:hypothetical protein
MGDWRLRASCRGEEPTWWDNAQGNDEGGQWKNRQAIAICRRCDVQRECIRDAAANREDGVIRGGVRFTGQSVDARRCWRCRRWFITKKSSGRRFCRDLCQVGAAA